MSKPRLCIVCQKNPAQLPDRNTTGRPIKTVCKDCHHKRVLGDLQELLLQKLKEPK